jgi:hypothetical protein
MAANSSYDAYTSKSQADPIFQKHCNQRYDVEAGEARAPQAAAFIKAANTSHGRRCFPAVGGQMAARPFQEFEGLDWTPLKTEQATKVQQGSKSQKRIAVKSLQPSKTQTSMLQSYRARERPSGGPAIFGKRAALQWGSELPLDKSQKEQIAKGLTQQQMSSSSEGFFNVFLPPRKQCAPIRAWRPHPPERPSEERSPKLCRSSQSAPDLNFTQELCGKRLLKDGSSAAADQRFNETLSRYFKDRSRGDTFMRPLPLSFNVTLRELKGMHLTVSEREPGPFSPEFKAAMLIKDNLNKDYRELRL